MLFILTFVNFVQARLLEAENKKTEEARLKTESDARVKLEQDRFDASERLQERMFALLEKSNAREAKLEALMEALLKKQEVVREYCSWPYLYFD